MFPRIFYRAHHNSDPPHRYPRIIYVCSTNTVASETCVDIITRGALRPLSRTEIFRRRSKLASKRTHKLVYIHINVCAYNNNFIIIMKRIYTSLYIYIYTRLLRSQGMSLIFVRPKFMGSWLLALSARNTNACGIDKDFSDVK